MQGICYKEHLFNAIVEGRKRMTRRIINCKNYPINDDSLIIKPYSHPSLRGINFAQMKEIGIMPDGNPYYEIIHVMGSRYKPGEIVYLKEPYYFDGENYYYKYLKKNAIDAFDHFPYEILSGIEKWKNKLFMPTYAARYFTKMKDVRAERIQDISDEDCIKEGIIEFPYGFHWEGIKQEGNTTSLEAFSTPCAAYAVLIDLINGRGTWESNPWVWAY